MYNPSLYPNILLYIRRGGKGNLVRVLQGGGVEPHKQGGRT